MQQVNPNTATAQSHRYTFKKEVDFACTPGSLPKGTIALTKTGVAIYNPLTSANLNAGKRALLTLIISRSLVIFGWWQLNIRDIELSLYCFQYSHHGSDDLQQTFLYASY